MDLLQYSFLGLHGQSDLPCALEDFQRLETFGVLTVGSGRLVDVKVFGDPNQDGNSSNDRLPG
jgi:hypothetical protein